MGFWIFSAVVAGLLILLFGIMYYCYQSAFSIPEKAKIDDDSHIPHDDQYDPFRAELSAQIGKAVATPYEDVWIRSHDGLRLHGRFYATAPDAPVQIFFHGYRSGGVRDFCVAMPRSVSDGFNTLLIDERGHGESEGKCLTFGVLERRDCLAWTEYAVRRFGQDVKIVLYGMSMGAATVLMAADLPLPQNVVGIIADCGYSSPKGIIRKVIRDRRLPVGPSYALVRLGARVFGGFSLEASSAAESMKHCRVPVLLIHGTDDRFVPCEMSQENYDCCASPEKTLLLVPDAGHGLSYLLDRDGYSAALVTFYEKVLQTVSGKTP